MTGIDDPTGLNDKFSRAAEGAEAAAPDLDLTPRDLTPKAGKRNWLPIILCVGIAAAIIGVLMTTLGDSALFIYNADRAVEQRGELAESRFRLQGSPVGNTVEGTLDGGEGVQFTVNFEGQLVDVVHAGSPAELFQSGVPVVLEGAWVQTPLGLDGGANDGWHFSSDNMIVSHDNDYRLENEQRLDDAKQGGAAYSQ